MARIYNEKMKRMKRFVSKRYTKQWKKLNDGGADYLSNFGVVVSVVNNGVLIYYVDNNKNLYTQMQERKTKVQMIETLVTQFHKKQIDRQTMLNTIASFN